MHKLLIISLTLSAMSAFGKVKVIYGEDNRLDVYEETNSTYIKLASSTAALVEKGKLRASGAYETELTGQTLESRGICADERFAKQPTVAHCSGFLVGKNKLVTAGHCIRTTQDCKANVWVFDFKLDHEGQDSFVVDNNNIYNCKRIISRELEGGNGDDYALIELDRDVEDREPLTFRTEGAPKKGDKLVVIGHPTGLPSKIAAGAEIKKINSVYFSANLDTYGGNSGSAVFNADTGVVEGILVRGATDYVFSAGKGCRISNRVSNDRGEEDVTRITNIKELVGGSTTGDDEDPYAGIPRWLRWILGLPLD